MSPRRNKYNAQKTVVDGITFDSKKEACRYSELVLLQRAGEITHLELQPKIMLFSGTTPVRGESGRQLFYRADFRYFDIKLERRVIEDCKGFKTKEYLLKKAFVKAMQPGLEVVET
jgi:hypothetical protein